jgi:hypothetical protein
MFRFTIREVLWLTVVVALGLCFDAYRLSPLGHTPVNDVFGHIDENDDGHEHQTLRRFSPFVKTGSGDLDEVIGGNPQSNHQTHECREADRQRIRLDERPGHGTPLTAASAGGSSLNRGSGAGATATGEPFWEELAFASSEEALSCAVECAG